MIATALQHAEATAPPAPEPAGEYSPSPAQSAQLAAFVDLLAKWNRVYNLTAVRDPAAMWERHVQDCLSCIGPIVERQSIQKRTRLLDVGSGAGLPGVVIAIMLPNVDVTCIDAVGKKAAFVREAASVLRLANLQSLHGRVEDVEDQFDLITARAFTSLRRMVDLTARALSNDGSWLAMKGVVPTDELNELDSSVYAFHVEQVVGSQHRESRCLVTISRKKLAHAS